jgi:type IX secretion system PorP/SprF family membrane protein
MLNNEKMAVGASVYKDVAAADSRLSFLGTYAYHLRLKKDLSLSLGLSAGFMQYKIDNTIINPIDEGDPLFEGSPLTSVVPTATFGAYLYAEDYYVSFSAPQIITSTFNVKDDLEEDVLFGELTNHFYLGGGYNKVLNDNFTIQPSLLLIMSPPAPLVLEVMTKVTYNRMMWAAVSYRLGDAIGLFLGYDINDQFYIAYGHDFVTSSLSSVTSGSNEFKLGFKFNKSSSK